MCRILRLKRTEIAPDPLRDFREFTAKGREEGKGRDGEGKGKGTEGVHNSRKTTPSLNG